MEKRQLIELLHHYSSSSTQEAEEVISLREAYPYSQVIQALSARVSKDHNFYNQQQLLQSAAVYVTDRSVLKEIMSHSFTQSAPVTLVVEALVKVEEPKQVVHEATISIPVNQTIDSIDYAEEILIDLKRLNELKLNFESVVAGIQNHEPEVTFPRKSPGRPKKKIEPIQDPLIESIETTKKKIEPENSITKEQIAIIDEFIKAQPNISTKLKADPNPQALANDLAEIKTGEYSDTVVSETLAEILIKQGKKEKAIDVLRKLIWKFPQKKAYFAAQIEELKK